MLHRSQARRLVHKFNQCTTCCAQPSAPLTHVASNVAPASTSDRDTAYEFRSANLRFGSGVTSECGMDLVNLGASRVCVVTDKRVASLPIMDSVLKALRAEQLSFDVFDDVRVEPTDKSLHKAIAFAQNGNFDAFLAVGGGSVIDTAKAANLYSTHREAEFLDFVNAPVGNGKVIPNNPRLAPLVAIPTTSGTGSETSGVLIFDFEEIQAKTAISGRCLTPSLGLVDPDHAQYMPRGVVVASGFDVFCHALESFTGLPYNERPKPSNPRLRPLIQGSNPVADVWCREALLTVQKYFFRAANDPEDTEARTAMMNAATQAGLGFNNAGVHLCHGMSYALSGLVKDYVFPGYEDCGGPIVPHGVAVALMAPAVFRFTCHATPERHFQAVEWLAPHKTARTNVRPTHAASVGRLLAETVLEYMEELDVPLGLAHCGFSSDDVPSLVEGSLPQGRLLSIAPSRVDADILSAMFEDSMLYGLSESAVI